MKGRLSLIAAACAALVACGGGGGDPPTPTVMEQLAAAGTEDQQVAILLAAINANYEMAAATGSMTEAQAAAGKAYVQRHVEKMRAAIAAGRSMAQLIDDEDDIPAGGGGGGTGGGGGGTGGGGGGTGGGGGGDGIAGCSPTACGGSSPIMNWLRYWWVRSNCAFCVNPIFVPGAVRG